MKISNSFKIPNSFKLLGHEIKIELDENYQNKTDYYGMAKYRENRIIIDSNKSRLESQLEETFCHELVHFILLFMANKLEKDEQFVSQFSGLLHQVLTTMEFK